VSEVDHPNAVCYSCREQRDRARQELVDKLNSMIKENEMRVVTLEDLQKELVALERQSKILSFIIVTCVVAATVFIILSLIWRYLQ
jgi:hypothetical protein